MRFPAMWFVRPARLRPACAYAQSDQSLCLSLEYFMRVKLLTEHIFEILSFKGGCSGSSESTLVKILHCWKSHVAAYICSVAVWVSIVQHRPTQEQKLITRILCLDPSALADIAPCWLMHRK